MIYFDLSVEMAKKKMTLTELAKRLGLSMVNTSLLKNGKVKGIRFETLNRICEILECTPADIIIYKKDDSSDKS